MNLIFWCKKHSKLLCIDAVCIVAALIITGCMSHMIGLQYSQQEADRWQADGTIKYHQVSAFIQNDSGVGLETISQVRSDIQVKLTEASFGSDSVTGRLWIDAYAAQAKDSLSKTSDTGMSSVESVNVMGVGGDFFQFHMQDMLAGSTFSDDDLSQDKVLIDRNAAWALYGGVDIAGKTIEIGGRQFVISGVYEADGDKTETMARGSDSYIFMDYDVFHELYPGSNITVYEAVIPNPVKGFALLALKEAFGESQEDLYTDDTLLSFSDKEYVDNTGRFRTGSLLGRFVALPRLLMRTTQISYPYWENTVRALELKLEVLLLLKLLLLAPVLVTFVWMLIIACKMLRQFIKDNFGKWMDFIGRKYDDMARARMQKRKEAEEAEEAEQAEIVARAKQIVQAERDNEAKRDKEAEPDNKAEQNKKAKQDKKTKQNNETKQDKEAGRGGKAKRGKKVKREKKAEQDSDAEQAQIQVSEYQVPSLQEEEDDERLQSVLNDTAALLSETVEEIVGDGKK